MNKLVNVAFLQFQESGTDFEVVPLEGYPGFSYYAEPWTTECFNDVLSPWPDAPRPSAEPDELMAWIESEGHEKVWQMLVKDGHHVVEARYYTAAELDIELGVSIYVIRDRIMSEENNPDWDTQADAEWATNVQPENLQADFRRTTKDADLFVHVEEGRENSGGFLTMTFKGTFKGQPLEGTAHYGMSRPDANALVVDYTNPEISDEDYETLLLAVLDDAPEWNEWANYAMSKTPGGTGEDVVDSQVEAMVDKLLE